MVVEEYLSKLKDKIVEGEVEFIFQELKELLAGTDDSLYDTLIILEARHKKYHTENIRGTLMLHNNEQDRLNEDVLKFIGEIGKNQKCRDKILQIKVPKQVKNALDDIKFGGPLTDNPRIQNKLINVEKTIDIWIARNRAGVWLEDQSPQLEHKIIQEVRASSITIDNIFRNSEDRPGEYFCHVLIFLREQLKKDGHIKQSILDEYLKKNNIKAEDEYDPIYARLFKHLINYIKYLQTENKLKGILHPLSQKELLMYLKTFYNTF